MLSCLRATNRSLLNSQGTVPLSLSLRRATAQPLLGARAEMENELQRAVQCCVDPSVSPDIRQQVSRGENGTSRTGLKLLAAVGLCIFGPA